MKRLFGGLAALAAVLSLAACGGTTDRQGDAYKTVVSWTTAFQKRNFYDACQLEAVAYNKGIGVKYGQALGVKYTDLRACAVGYEAQELQPLMFGTPFYEGFVVAPKPVTGHKTPKNGYVFKVKYAYGTIYVSVQRDSHGDWKVTGVEG